MITRVIIVNAENRAGRDNFGEEEQIEITGNQFIYILRNIDRVPALFDYLNAVGAWEQVKAQ